MSHGEFRLHDGIPIASFERLDDSIQLPNFESLADGSYRDMGWEVSDYTVSVFYPMPRASQPNHDKVINIGDGLLIKKAKGYWGRGGNGIDVCDNTNDLKYPYRNISLPSYDLDKVFVTTDRVLREAKISYDLWKRNKKYDGSEVTTDDFKWFNALAIVPGNYHWTNKKTRLSDKFAESFDEAPPFASTEHWKLGRIMLLKQAPEVK